MLNSYAIKCFLNTHNSINLNVYPSSSNSPATNPQEYSLNLGKNKLDGEEILFYQPTSSHIKNVFTEILKANIMDPDVPDTLPAHLINLSFDLYHQIALALEKKLQEKSCSIKNIFPINCLKDFATFVSHLRFKPTNPSANEL